MEKTAKTIIARAQHVLVTPRKANLILETLVGRKAATVLKELSVSPKRAADPIAKLIKQGIGNAVSLHSASPDSLVIHEAYATKGRTLKRFQIGGRGRTKPYERTASHLTLKLRAAKEKSISPAKAVQVAAPASGKTEKPVVKTAKTKKIKEQITNN